MMSIRETMALTPLAVESGDRIICGDDGDDVIFGGSGQRQPVRRRGKKDLMFGGKGGSVFRLWLRPSGGGATPFTMSVGQGGVPTPSMGGAPWEQVNLSVVQRGSGGARTLRTGLRSGQRLTTSFMSRVRDGHRFQSGRDLQI